MPPPNVERVNRFLEQRFEELRRLRLPAEQQREAIERLRKEFGLPETYRDLFSRAATEGVRVRELAQRLVAEQPADLKLFQLALAPQGDGASTIQSMFQRMFDRGITQDRTVDAVRDRASAGPQAQSAREAAARMRELVSSGKLQRYYDAITGQGDAALKTEALEFFKSLPKVTADTPVEQLVEMGLIPRLPQGWAEMNQTARYLPGRQVMVETHIEVDFQDARNFGRYKENGQLGITHRATLVGEEGSNFLVKVDGRDEPLRVPKTTVARLNQPQEFRGDRFSLNGVVVDYNDPYTKAKIHEGFARLAPIIEQLNFNKALGDPNASTRTIDTKGQVFQLQQQAVRVIHDLIRMSYSHDMNSGDSAGRLAIQGSGQCYSQAAVMTGLLAPYSKLLGIDIQFINGKVYRNATRGPGYPYNGGNHGWLQVTYRPGGITMITDRTWSQPSIEMDYAYSWTGDRVPRGLMGVNGRDSGQPPLQPTDVNFTGTVIVPTRERLFGVKGVHDRSQHQ